MGRESRLLLDLIEQPDILQTLIQNIMPNLTFSLDPTNLSMISGPDTTVIGLIGDRIPPKVLASNVFPQPGFPKQFGSICYVK